MANCIKNRKQKYVAIEGNVGAGKTSVLEMLPSSFCEKNFEPLHLYTEYQGEDPLKLSYSHPVSCGSTAQHYITQMSNYFYRNELLRLRTKYQKLDYDDKPVIISERSVISPLIFIKAKGAVFHTFPKAYLWAHAFGLSDYHASIFQPTYTILLAPEPQLCFDRMKERGNDSEFPVSLTYIEKLGATHLLELDDKPNNITVKFDENTTKEELRDRIIDIVMNLDFTK